MKPLAEARLYGIVDIGYVPSEAAPVAAERLVAGGVDVLQIRAKSAPVEIVAGLAREIHPITRAAGVPLILNDHAALLREIPAEGVHVGQDDAGIEEARRLAGRPVIVGKSTHSVAQALSAAEEGADYIGFGPLFATPTKPGRPPIGLDGLVEVDAMLSIPVFAIGGIKLQNLGEVRAAGARRVVIVSGWLQADDIPAAVRAARQLLDS